MFIFLGKTGQPSLDSSNSYTLQWHGDASLTAQFCQHPELFSLILSLTWDSEPPCVGLQLEALLRAVITACRPLSGMEAILGSAEQKRAASSQEGQVV